MRKTMIQKLWNKFVTKETISYLIFGVLTTIVNYVVFEICQFAKIHYLIGTGIAWVLAVMFAYITNKLFVFESKSWKKEVIVKELTSFVACRAISGLFDLGFMALAVELLSMNKSIAKLVSNVFVVIANYIFSKLFIFKKQE